MKSFAWFRDARLKNKLIIMVLPLVVVPVLVVGGIVGTVASDQAYLGMTQTSRADLEHMAQFTVDLLSAHRRQFEVYRQDKKETIRADLAALTDFAVSLVEAQDHQYVQGRITLEQAKAEAATAIKKVSVGQSGYAYAMTSGGELVAHIAREGERILDEVDDDGRRFIREMCQNAVTAAPGRVLHIVYPWKNALLGDKKPRDKTVAYRYYKPWDWIIAVGGYLDETYEDKQFAAASFEELKERVKAKKVGSTGYIYALDSAGTAVIHPFREGENLIEEVDDEGRPFIREMVEKKSGWIRYPWKNVTDKAARMKVVRYEHFEPWGWVVAVGSYENEFFAEAEVIRTKVNQTMLALMMGAALVSTLMLLWASKVFTDPISRMTHVIHRVRGGQLGEKMSAQSGDELGELATAYNRMIELVEKHQGLEQNLAQQGKMASLGVLSSGVAHEINNPLGVILGYAAYLENKLDEDDPNRTYISQIRKECRRSKKIVQDLLSYSRAPRPAFAPIDVNDLLQQLVDFAYHHADMTGVEIATDFEPGLSPLECDGDQLRQVAINLILNAGAAMDGAGTLVVSSSLVGENMVELSFADTGPGMDDEVKEKIFEPFFTTRAKGTGLGLAITRQIVERHQGSIAVETSPGQGAKIKVRLPLKHEEF